jgi:electron transfer flavoprotein beta subunit
VKLPDIMKAKKKPLETLDPASLGVDAGAQLKLVRFEPPAQRSRGVMVKSVPELVEALQKKGLV